MLTDVGNAEEEAELDIDGRGAQAGKLETYRTNPSEPLTERVHLTRTFDFAFVS